MFELVIQKQKERKHWLIMTIFLFAFLYIYTLIDSFNMSYLQMTEKYGLFLVIINISLNFIMSVISSVMMSISYAYYKLSGKEGTGSFFSALSVLFGMLTYGCTTCVIALFASIGITFSVALLPLAGLPYKFVSLALIILGFLWLIREIKHSKCRLK